MKKVYNLKNAKGGAAVTLICCRHKTKRGWGKINQDGNVEFFIAEALAEFERDELIISAFADLLNMKENQIEIFSGRQDRMIVTILGLDSDRLDRALSNL